MSSTELTHLRKVLGAAEALLGARAIGGIDADDWALLERAVAEATHLPLDKSDEAGPVDIPSDASPERFGIRELLVRLEVTEENEQAVVRFLEKLASISETAISRGVPVSLVGMR